MKKIFVSVFLATFVMISSVAMAQTWWDSAWKYREQITVTENSGSNLKDYPIGFVLDLSNQISQQKISRMLQDLRFSYYDSTSNREIEIPYWIENPESYIASSGFAGWASQTSSYFVYYNPANGLSYGISSSFTVSNSGSSIGISSTTIGPDWETFFAPGAYGKFYYNVPSYGKLITFDVYASSTPCTSNLWMAELLIGGQALWKEDVCKLTSARHVEILNNQYSSTLMEFKLEPTAIGGGYSVGVAFSNFNIVKTDPTAFKNINVWTKVPSIPASGNSILYMYYGNPGAAGKSSPSIFSLKYTSGINGASGGLDGAVVDIASDSEGKPVSVMYYGVSSTPQDPYDMSLSLSKMKKISGTSNWATEWNKEWSKGRTSSLGYAASVETDSHDNIIFLDSQKMTKHDTDGKELWNKPTTCVYGLATDSQDNIICESTSDKKLIKYNSNGDKVWEKILPSSQCSISTDASDNIIVGCGSFLGKYDKNGNSLWTKTVSYTITSASAKKLGYYGSIPFTKIRGSVATDSNDDIYITALSSGIRKLDKNGNELWNVPISSAYYTIEDMTVDSASDQIIVVGSYLYSSYVRNHYKWFVLKYLPSGKSMWGATYGDQGQYGENSHEAYAVASGSAIVGGYMGTVSGGWYRNWPMSYEFYDTHYVKPSPTYSIGTTGEGGGDGGAISGEEALSITLLPGQSDFEISAMKLNLIDGEALNLTVDMDYTTVAWDVSYPSDIGVACYLNCKNPGTDIDKNCASSKSCSYEGSPGRRSCTINGPIYSVPPSNNATCKFYDLSQPQLAYMPYPNRTFNFIFFKTEVSGGTATVGNEFILPVKILDLGLYPDSYRVKTNAITNPEYVIISMQEINTEKNNYGETAIVNDKLRFIYAGNMKLEILTKSNTMPTTNFPSSCNIDSQCEYLGQGSKCITNACWTRTEIDIKSQYASLPEYGLFGLIVILISSAAIGFRKF